MIKNKLYANKSVVTFAGRVSFDKDGFANPTEAQERTLLRLRGSEKIEEKKEEKQEYVDVPEFDQEVWDKHEEETKKKLEDKTVAELKKLAKEKGIELEATKKADIIKEILGNEG